MVLAVVVDRARPRPAAMGDRQRRARVDPDPALLPTPAYEFDQRLTLVATTVDARLCATPAGLVPAAARLPARGRLGVSARAKVQRQRAEQPLPPKIDA